MADIDQVLDLARRLDPRDRRRLVERLAEEGLSESAAAAPEGREPAMRKWLALAGTGHSDFTDVSANKYEHLSHAYSSKT